MDATLSAMDVTLSAMDLAISTTRLDGQHHSRALAPSRLSTDFKHLKLRHVRQARGATASSPLASDETRTRSAQPRAILRDLARPCATLHNLARTL
eukprot:4420368-Pleurochrysis_carterae.AAC.3